MSTIMIIDDDIHIGNMLEETFRQEGFRIFRAYSGTEALLLLSTNRPDLVLLDLMLPGLSGEELLPKLTGIPVIVVSAKVDIQDKVELLMAGAADYVAKPFDMKELIARVQVQLRNASAMGKAPMLTFENLVMDTTTHMVRIDNNEVKLTKTEYAILRQLLLNPSVVVTKSRLLDLISFETPDCVESSLKVHLSNLRRKLHAGGGQDYIETVWGIGYKLYEK